MSGFKNVTWGGMAPPPLRDFIKQSSQSSRLNRSASKDDCVISHSLKLFRKSAFSVKALVECSATRHTRTKDVQNLLVKP